ncbi:DJ-1/PfpI family protein [Neokomagataea thailandica]|uniref:Intracellular protease/amidase n=1 Tax=Neokomagataea tanensis NBRC 106556 TaxID=1223519 RepID=A0ABQ0QG13_9PROT|nr:MULTISPECIES: DJ-1/PfpI family protein [Neokomagataea]GBR43380.1 putative intracellular protease/amidase [Neokomagataea tanensis NBRC 106556]
MSLTFGLLCFPGVQQLDLTGPYEVFASVPNSSTHLLWKDLQPIRSATGLILTPDTTLTDAPDFDVLCIPGGAGTNALLTDTEILSFIRNKASKARYVTSVCTGALVLGQAGLLSGKRATTHWNALDFLPHFGASIVKERVVQDDNIITAGGITSGIDFALTLVAELLSQEEAETIQLALEYAPAPPFSAGLPSQARPTIIDSARQRMEAARLERHTILHGDT